MLRRVYNSIMDHEQNPFSGLPRMVRFQFMLMLSYMWSSVFTILVGSYLAFLPMVVGHTAVLVAIFFTADLFRRARVRTQTHRDLMKNPADGTALYDDIWGG